MTDKPRVTMCRHFYRSNRTELCPKRLWVVRHDGKEATFRTWQEAVLAALIVTEQAALAAVKARAAA